MVRDCFLRLLLLFHNSFFSLPVWRDKIFAFFEAKVIVSRRNLVAETGHAYPLGEKKMWFFS